jgi:hypothetical protein
MHQFRIMSPFRIMSGHAARESAPGTAVIWRFGKTRITTEILENH